MADDNLFDRLADLFRSSGPVNWRLAREIAESVAGDHEPVEPWLAEEYRDLATTAGMRIAAMSPLDPSRILTDVRPVDRRTWAGDNVESLAYLADPLADKMTGMTALGPGMQPLGPALIGMQMGSVTGFMSRRVLGGFDVGLPAGESEVISFVVPNVEEFAAEHSLDLRQTRLWVALHEVTHQAEFAVPWVREHLLMLMHSFVDGLEADPADFGRRIEGLQDPAALQEMLQAGGMSGLLAGSADERSLHDIQAFMALMEGYGDYLIDRAAPGLIPQAPRMRAAIDQRRAEPSEGEQILHQMMGLDLQHGQYRLGATFCAEVDRRWGEESLARIWEGPEMLPSLPELRDPVGWAARVLL
jgi:putative hydrolase